MNTPGLSGLSSSGQPVNRQAPRTALAACRFAAAAWVFRALLFAAMAPTLSACTNAMLASARRDMAAGHYAEAHQQLETALQNQASLRAGERVEAQDDLCTTEFVIGAPTYSLLRQHQTCAQAAAQPGSASGENLAKIDAILRQQDEAEIEHALKVGDIAGAVAALRRYHRIAPEDTANIARWDRQIWSAVVKQDLRTAKRQKKEIHRTLSALREDYPKLRSMNQHAFKSWLGRDTSASGVPMLSGIAIAGHTLELKVPERNLDQSALSPQKFAQINDAFSVWCQCDGATHVAADATGLPVYLARLNPAVSRSEVLVLPRR
jgi:hypothetical protein